MKKRTVNKLVRIIACSIVLLLLLIIGAGLIFKFTSEDKYFGDFRIEYDGEVLTGTDNSVMSYTEGNTSFYVKGTSGYSVEIIPNTDFDYTVDGYTFFSFKDEDLSKLIVGAYSDYFIVNIPTSVNKFLLEIWNGLTVTVPKDITEYCYKIVVTSKSKGAVIEIAVCGYRFKGDVEFDVDHVYF